jgi:hypothetical protein|tara:strand:+ start:1383 stop:1574 length:192 start_codon:yes stop_codon:yes gene_type:complete
MGLELLQESGCDLLPVALSQVSGIPRQKNNDPDLQPIGVQSLFSCYIQVNKKPRPEDRKKSLF